MQGTIRKTFAHSQLRFYNSNLNERLIAVASMLVGERDCLALRGKLRRLQSTLQPIYVKQAGVEQTRIFALWL
jgi:hypothetical protein